MAMAPSPHDGENLQEEQRVSQAVWMCAERDAHYRDCVGHSRCLFTTLIASMKVYSDGPHCPADL